MCPEGFVFILVLILRAPFVITEYDILIDKLENIIGLDRDLI